MSWFQPQNEINTSLRKKWLETWQEMYELEATEYHELDSLPINQTSKDTSYSVIQNLYLNGLGQTDSP